MYLDPMYFVFVMPALLLAFYAQMQVRSAYSKWLKVANTRSMSGADALLAIRDFQNALRMEFR